MDPAVEQALIEQLKHGDQRALGVFYQEFSSGVFACCVKILADREQAEDVVQETFLKVQRYVRSIKKEESFKSSSFRIARNEALMQIRKRRQNGQIDDETVCSSIGSSMPGERRISLAI